MGSQVSNLYPQFEASAEEKSMMSNLYQAYEVDHPAKTYLANFYQAYEVDYPANSRVSNAFVQFEVLVSPLDEQSRIANFVLQYELQALTQNPEFGPRLSSET